MRPLTVNGLKARYKLSYAQNVKQQKWRKYVRVVHSNQPTGEEYGGAMGVTGMSERKGENITHTLPSETWVLKHRRFEGGLHIPQDDWEFNKTDDVDAAVDKLSMQAAAHPGTLMSEVLAAGTSYTGADGVNFFSASHPIGDTTMSNLFTSASVSELNVATATKPTSSEWADALTALAVKMLLFQDDAETEVNLGNTRFAIFCPPGLYPSCLKALGQELIGNGETNPIAAIGEFTFEIIFAYKWSATANIIMMAQTTKPVAYQWLRKPELVKVFGPGTEYFDLNEEVFAKAHGTYNCGLDRWQGACYATFS